MEQHQLYVYPHDIYGFHLGEEHLLSAWYVALLEFATLCATVLATSSLFHAKISEFGNALSGSISK